MALLTVNSINQNGLDISATAVAADPSLTDSVKAAGDLFFYVENNDAGAHTVTVAKPQATAQCGNLGTLTVNDIVISVPAGEARSFTIPQGYSDASGNFAWTYDAVTSITVGVFSLA